MYPPAGQTLGNYIVGEPIGRGAVGVVLAGTHRYLGHPVAIKVLVGLHAFDPVAAARFIVEARAARAIGHPNVVAVLDFGESDSGDPYLVMERLDGRTLAEALRGGPLGSREAARLAGGVAAGLAAAHAQGTVHRDIKPANLFLVPSEGGARIKILDFGLAKAVSSAGHTAPDAVMGTPRYMAPDQAEGAARAGTKSDVYSLGAVLYEMVAGRPPFAGDEPGPLLRAHLLEAPPPPRRFVVLDRDLEALILRCLEKDPARRPDAVELAEALGRIAGSPSAAPAGPGLGGRARRPALFAVALVLGASSMGALAIGLRSLAPHHERRSAVAPWSSPVIAAPPSAAAARDAAAAEAPVQLLPPAAPAAPGRSPARMPKAPAGEVRLRPASPPRPRKGKAATPDPGPRIPPNDSLD